MKVERIIHSVWKQWQLAGAPYPQIIGKYQWLYSSPKGRISLVELPDYFGDGKVLWEIYSLDGDLFDDVERFDSKTEAEEKIRLYLE